MLEFAKLIGIVSAGWLLAIGAVWALLKYWGQGMLDRYFKSKEIQAQHEHEIRARADEQRHNEQVELIRHQFALLQRKEDIRFQQLHPERTKKLIEVFEGLHQLRTLLKQYVGSLRMAQADKEERYDAFEQLKNELWRDYELHRYYFSTSNIQHVDNVFTQIQRVDETVIELIDFNPQDFLGPESKDLRLRQSETIRSGRDQIRVHVQRAIVELEAEIRRTLGVED